LADFLSTLKRLIIKELRVEFRSRGMIGTALSFTVSSVIMAGIGYGGFLKDIHTAAVLFWIIALFSAMTPVSHLFIREEEEGTIGVLRIRFRSDAVFLSKLICGMLFVLLSLLVMAPLYVAFFNIYVADAALFVAVILAGGSAAACASAFAGALASRAGGKSALFAVLSIPAVLPVLIVSVSGTIRALSGAAGGWGDAAFCLCYGAVMAAVSVWLYEKIWMEE
jgi:heme exporter protein B